MTALEDMQMKLQRKLRMKQLGVGLLGVVVLTWATILVLMSKLHGNSAVTFQNTGTVPKPERRRTGASVLCGENHNNGGINVKDIATMLRLERELNSGWNQTNRPTRVLNLGTHGYTKRDLPVYEAAFTRRTIMVLPRPSDGKYKDNRDFDTILCLSFNTESCLEKEDFAKIGRNRKINRIKSLREVLWSKHTFCNTLTAATKSFAASDFFFPCWVMPEQYEDLQRDSARLKISRWISKPRSLGAGMGITVVDNLRDVKRSSTHVIQEYMKRPHLLKGADGQMHKWDMRTYVLVTSVMPLRAYVYQRGLVRLATSPYSEDCKSNNQTACLTNTSINKKMVGAKLKDITWSFKKLRDYLGNETYKKLFLKMQRAVGMTLLSSLHGFAREWEGSGDDCESCYQLLGVDVIFDEKLNAKVIECNGEPSMQTTSGGKTHYDITKKNMIQDLVNLVFQDISAARETQRALKQRIEECKSNVKLKKSDVSYLLDLFREAKSRGEFAPVYPNLALDEEYRKFLTHLSTAELFPKHIQKRMRGFLQSHMIFTDVLSSSSSNGAMQEGDDFEANEKPVSHRNEHDFESDDADIDDV